MKNSNIITIQELNNQRLKLKKRLEKREKKISKSFKRIENAVKPENLTSNILGKLDINTDSISTAIPFLIKHGSTIINNKLFGSVFKLSKRNLAVASMAGVGIGLAAMLLKYKKKANSGDLRRNILS